MALITFLNFAAALQGIFLTCLLVNKKPRRKENVVLGLLLFVMSVSLLGAVLGLSGYYRQIPHLVRVGDPFVLLFGPLLYFYIFILINGRLPELFWLHLLPFLIYVASAIPFYLLPASEKIEFVNKIFLTDSLSSKVIVIQIVRLTLMAVYIVLSYHSINRYQKRIRASFSDIDKISLESAGRIMQLFLAGTLISIGIYFSGWFFSMHFILTNNIVGLFLCVIIYVLAYSTWNKSGITDGMSAADNEVRYCSGLSSSDNNIGIKTRDTYFLTDDQVHEYSQLLQNMLDGGIYLENDLTLASLSKKMGLQPYLVSELINRYAGEPFFDFINRHRVNEIKQRLTDSSYSYLSILGIAFECGFNSKSSFNAAFKKFTGITPSEFRQKNAA